MKIMIVGGKIEQTKEWEKIKKICIEIGKRLRVHNHSLEVCSPFEDSADYWVLKGYIEEGGSKGAVSFHYVKWEQVEEKIESLTADNIFINRIPLSVSKTEKQYAWLLCQLEALESCQCVIAIGGKVDGSANMLLRFADIKRKIVVPFAFSKGAAQLAYERRIYQLTDMFGNSVGLLNDNEHYLEIIEKIDVGNSSNKETNEERKVFISYARKRPYEADYIETLLRRRGISVFRDENEFGAGKEIPMEIEENIHKCNTFIAVYCVEYACSPWCFDELELALKLKENKELDIWILCVDDTRIIPKKARDLVYYKIEKREELEGKLLQLLQS